MRIPKKPPKLSELLEKKGFKLTELGNPVYSELIRQCEKNYWHWDTMRHVAHQKGVDAELVWMAVKYSRIQRYKNIDLRGEAGVKLKYIVPDAIQQELMMIDRELARRLGCDDDKPLAEEQGNRFILNALAEEAIASSMLEGAVTTRREARQMLASERKPRTPGERMVFNNYRAIQFIRQQRQQPLSVEFLIRIQSILTEGTLERADEVGRFRQPEDKISVVDASNENIIHEPPPASELGQRMEQLCAFANTENGDDFIHPVIKACILHFQIGFDHPFCDGNGRTARALFYWYMLRQRYWLFEYLPISRLIYKSPAQYVEAYLYTEHDEFDLTYFLDYNIKRIAQARKELHAYMREKQKEMGRARQAFTSDTRLNHRQREVILQAVRNPEYAFTIASHQTQHAVAYDTARNDLLDLVAWGYMVQRRVSNRFEFLPADKLTRADDLFTD